MQRDGCQIKLSERVNNLTNATNSQTIVGCTIATDDKGVRQVDSYENEFYSEVPQVRSGASSNTSLQGLDWDSQVQDKNNKIYKLPLFQRHTFKLNQYYTLIKITSLASNYNCNLLN